jgi:N-acetylmuramoyl-L-alanine amidase
MTSSRGASAPRVIPLAPVAPPNPPEPALTPTTQPWIRLDRWCAANRFGLRRLTIGASPFYSVTGPGGTFMLHAGSELGQWNGTELRMGFAPQIIRGAVEMHVLDLGKMLQPLLSGARLAGWGESPVIVLDPGHGGGDSGTKSAYNGRLEKEYTLDWALRLGRYLETNGWQVYLTRADDSEVALSNRVTFAEERHADLFLSLHFNSAAPNESEAGLETYCLTPVGMPSTLTRGVDDTTLVFPNNAFDTQNLLMALRVHCALLQVNGNNDRGIRHARFPRVLRGQQRPAILLEGGYLSNPQEARLIADPSYMQKLAEAAGGALLEPLTPRAAAFPSETPSPSTSQ